MTPHDQPLPSRVQLRRTRGWRKPPNTVVVSRPTIFGNPFGGNRATAVRAYRAWLVSGIVSQPDRTSQLGPDIDALILNARRHDLLRRLPSLRGKHLACWCPLADKAGQPVPCHADVLIQLANQPGDAT